MNESTIPTDRTYHLKCKIQVKKVSYEDEQSQGKLGLVEREMVYLLPVENSQAYAFLNAWMPAPGATSEVVLEFGHPFHQYGRGALLLPNQHFDTHHIFLMSYGLSQIIIAKKDLHGKEIDLSVLPESADHPDGSPTDHALHGELPFEQKEFDKGI